MSGILGLVDPRGPDLDLVRRAAGAASYRGEPDLYAGAGFVLGVFRKQGEPGLFRTPTSVLAAHARIDGAVRGGAIERIWQERRGPGTLDEVLGRWGPDGLMGVAGDHASARYDEQRKDLLLSRDAFGMRPIYWGRKGSAIAFASDPAVVAALGAGSLEIDERVVAEFLARREVADDRTPFIGIRTVEAGHWLRIDGLARVSAGTWFRPEDLVDQELTEDEAVEAVREVISVATQDRAKGRRVGLMLSSGRDSSTIAVVLGQLGIEATCITQSFDDDLELDEGGAARVLAEASGHRWVPSDVPSAPGPDAYQAIPYWAGTPCGYLGFPQATAPIATAAAEGVEVLMNGEGGEPLFSAGPIVVLDLLRRGRIVDAAAAARTFKEEWTYPYVTTAKAAVRAVLPTTALKARERLRPIPPWVTYPVSRRLDPVTAPRSERRHLLTSIRPAGGTAYDIDERLHQINGLEASSPLLDLRVVRCAVNLRPEMRAPIPGPKPLLARAFLNGAPGVRRKVTFQPYYRRLARASWEIVPEVFGAGSHIAKRGLIDPVKLRGARLQWPIESLALLPVEMWLAQR